jgi:hypothetical protein
MVNRLWDDRLAEVWASPGRAGSGVVIGQDVVLTARHVVAGALDGGRILARVVRPSAATAKWSAMRVLPRGVSEEWDLALLVLKDLEAMTNEAGREWEYPMSPTPVIVHLGTGAEKECEAVGFPDAESRSKASAHPSEVCRQSEQAVGVLLPAGQAKYAVHPDRALTKRWIPFDVGTSHPNTREGWRGISGGGVVLPDGRLVGLIVAAESDHQLGRLYVVPLAEALADSIDFAQTLRAICLMVEEVNAPRVRELLTLFDEAGRPYRARDVPALDMLGTRRARTDIELRGDPYYPYVRRDLDAMLDAALDARARGEDHRILLLAGDAMAGKSRSLAEAVRRHSVISTWRLLSPRLDANLEQVAELAHGSGTVIWLDDFNRYLPRINPDRMRKVLCCSQLIVVATIRADSLLAMNFQESWDLVTDSSLTEKFELSGPLSLPEQSPFRSCQQVLQEALAQGQSLGEVLAAAAEMSKRLTATSDLHRALAHLVADWSRAGIPTPLTESDAIRIWGCYLSEPRETWLNSRSAQERSSTYENVRDWLLQPVAGSTTTLIRRDPTGLISDGYLQQQRSLAKEVIPKPVWEAALGSAARSSDPANLMHSIARHAAPVNVYSIVWVPPEDIPEGNRDGARNADTRPRRIRTKNPIELQLDVTTNLAPDPSVVVLVAGRVFRNFEAEAARTTLLNVIACDYTEEEEETYYDDDGDRQTRTKQTTYTDTTKVTVDEVALAIPSALPAGSAFTYQAVLSPGDNGIACIATPTVNVSWKVECEVIGRKGKWSVTAPVDGIGVWKPKLELSNVGTEAVRHILGELIISTKRDRFRPGEQIEGTLAFMPNRNFTTAFIDVELQMTSLVHRTDGDIGHLTYKASLDKPDPQKKRIRFSKGWQVYLPFRVTVPDPLPGPTMANEKFSIKWAVRGRIRRRFRLTSIEVNKEILLLPHELVPSDANAASS